MGARSEHPVEGRPLGGAPTGAHWLETRLLAALDCLSEGFVALDASGRVRLASAPARAFLGCEGDGAIGRALSELIPAAGEGGFRLAFEAVLSGAGPVAVSLASPHAEGRTFALRLTAFEDGAALTIREVGEADALAARLRLQAEERARENEAKLRTLVSAVPAFIWFASVDGSVHYLNERWYEYTGQTPEEAVPDGWTATLHPDDVERTTQVWAAARAAEQSYEVEMRYRRRDGAYRWYIARAQPLRDASGRVTAWFGSSTDIHDLKQTEAALGEAGRTLVRERERLAIALVTGRLGAYERRIGEDVVWWSAETYALYGVDPSTFTPTLASLDALIHPEDRAALWRRLNQSIAACEAGAHEYRIVRPDGSIRWILTRWHVGLDASGRAERIIGAACDITENRRREEQVQLLLREVNHRSKNLLALVQAIARRTAARSAAEFLPRFEERVSALARAQDLLVRGDWTSVAVDELIRTQLGHFRDLIGGRIFLEGPPISLTPSAAQSLGMAFHELATNAAKYGALSNDVGGVAVSWALLARGGAARFSISWVERGGPKMAATREHGFGSTVLDPMLRAGFGADVEIGFEPQGLAWRFECEASRVVADAHAAPAALFPLGSAADAGERGSPRRSDLVVEDEPLVGMELAEALRQAGFRVVGPSHSNAEALRAIEEARFDLAVLDVNLGSETSEPIARRLEAAGVPFVVLTGYARDQLSGPLRRAPTLAKPVQLPLLLAALAQAQP